MRPRVAGFGGARADKNAPIISCEPEPACELKSGGKMKAPRTVRDVGEQGPERSTTDKTSGAGRGVIASEASRPRINPKWTWHYRILVTLRERLLHDRQARLAEAAQPLEAHSLSHADSATDEFDHNLALAALSAKQAALHEIEAAISRILNDDYGVCEETGQLIPAARLKAVPWTRFARQVEARHETEGESRPPHLGALGSVRGALTGDLEPMKSAAAVDAEERPATDEALRIDPAALGSEKRLPSAEPRFQI